MANAFELTRSAIIIVAAVTKSSFLFMSILHGY